MATDMRATPTTPDRCYLELADKIKCWGRELGFEQIGIADTELSVAEARLQDWLDSGMHGDMQYMARYGSTRSRPAELVPGTLRVISGRMNYWPESAADASAILNRAESAYVSRYALGRDYHKVLRKRLQQLARRIEDAAGRFGYRVFVDSAPVLEKPLAEKAGLGWIGKHTNLLDTQEGSWFFLGELYTDLPLPTDTPAPNHCGTCRRCIDVCPTNAIVAPYQLDARLCISYLTIEYRGSIPEALRPLFGNRIYGCDDCQLFCPWNRHARTTAEMDFLPRHGLDDAHLVSLFRWPEEVFLRRTEGMAIRRIGHESWLRNIAVALGNAPTSTAVVDALRNRTTHPSAVVREHSLWALGRHFHSR